MDLLQEARALYEKGEMHDALEVAQVACERKPKDAEAWWLLGCISRYTGMPAASDAAFKRAAELSRKRPAPQRVSTERFREILEAEREKLSGDARRRLAATELRVEPLPSLEQVKSGAVQPEAPSERKRKPQDVLTLFQVNLENRAGSEGELAKLVGRVLTRA